MGSFRGWCLINLHKRIFSLILLQKRHLHPKLICMTCSFSSCVTVDPRKSKPLDGISGGFCATPTNPKGRQQSGKRKRSEGRRRRTKTKMPKPGDLPSKLSHRSSRPHTCADQPPPSEPIIHSTSPLSSRVRRREGETEKVKPKHLTGFI